MKKIVIISLSILLVLAFICPSCVAYAQPTIKNETGMNLTSKEGLVMEYETGTVIFEHNSTNARPIASMTKIMTLLCVYDAINSGKVSLDDQVTISNRASSMGGSQVFLDENSVHRLDDLVKTVIICSANDSCVALAEHIYGSVELFVDKMNERAKQLNLQNTFFVNCTGLPAINQFSCAIDVAIMFRELIKNENYFKHSRTWMEDYLHPSGRVTGITNTNKLVRFYDGCDGGKTGYTSEAMHCLCATAKRGNTRYISVVIGAQDSKTRFYECSQLFNYAFSNFECKTFLTKGENVAKVSIKGGKSDELNLTCSENLSLFGNKGQINGEVVFDLPTSITAPKNIGDVVGVAYIVVDGNKVAQTNLIANENIAKKSFWDCIKDILGK